MITFNQLYIPSTIVVERSTSFLGRDYFHPVSAEACAICRAFRSNMLISSEQLSILQNGGFTVEIREPVTFAKAGEA